MEAISLDDTITSRSTNGGVVAVSLKDRFLPILIAAGEHAPMVAHRSVDGYEASSRDSIAKAAKAEIHTCCISVT